MNKEKFIKELRDELAMRRKVWTRISGFQTQFVSVEHQRKYDLLFDLEKILEEMTDREFLAISDRIERKKADKKAQSSLFT